MNVSVIEKTKNAIIFLRRAGFFGFIGVMTIRLINLFIVWPAFALCIFLVVGSGGHPFKSSSELFVMIVTDYAKKPDADNEFYIRDVCNDIKGVKNAETLDKPMNIKCENNGFERVTKEDAAKDIEKMLYKIYQMLVAVLALFGLCFWSRSPLGLRYGLVALIAYGLDSLRIKLRIAN